jgi:hypothetical protein
MRYWGPDDLYGEDMSFFTTAGVARFALRNGYLRLWRMALILDGRSLVAAEQVAAAASSPNIAAWGTVSKVFEDALLNPEAVRSALFASVEADNAPVLKQLHQQLQRLKADYSSDDLLLHIVSLGAASCWKIATHELKLTPSRKILPTLINSAFQTPRGVILDDLSSADYVPEIMKDRVRWRCHLQSCVQGKNTKYVRDVMAEAKLHGMLLPEDMAEAEAFLATANVHVFQRPLDMQPFPKAA